jgi:hypothetical protein
MVETICNSYRVEMDVSDKFQKVWFFPADDSLMPVLPG